MMLEDIPEGYAHKATSDSFNGTDSVVIYHNNAKDDYLVLFVHMDAEPQDMYVTKVQLELFIQSANDTVEMDSR